MQAVAEAMSKEKEVPMDNPKNTQSTPDNSEESIVDKILNLFSSSGAEDDQPTGQMKRSVPSEQQDMPLPTPRPKKTSAGRTLFTDPETGEKYSEKTITFEIDGRHVVFPTVTENGGRLTNDQIMSHIRSKGLTDPVTGRPLQTFSSSEDANAYAKSRSDNLIPTEQSENPMPIPKPRPIQRAEGGSVSQEKNDPPPGSTPEEVADDIPAYLSEGEYVLPANVVKYYGIANIKRMHDIALAQLQSLEDTGVIENVDENGKVEKDGDKETKALMDRLNGGPKEAKGTSISVIIPEGFNAGGGVSDLGQDDTLGEEDEDTSTPADLGQDDTLGEDDSPPMSQEDLENMLSDNVPDYGRSSFMGEADKFFNPQNPSTIPSVLSSVMGPLGLPATAVSVIADALSKAGYAVKQEDTPGPEGGLGEEQEKGLMSPDPDEDTTKITTAQDQYAPEGYVYVPGVGYRRKINPESAVDLRKGGGLMSY